MRIINSKAIIDAIYNLTFEANYRLPCDVKSCLQNYSTQETSPIPCEIFSEILANIDISNKEKIPLCQDTGMANFFVKIGREVFIEGAPLEKAINEGVSKGYTGNFLRASIVSDPLRRKNTGDNTPANIYVEIIDGDSLEITFLPKGGGAENASALKMLNPLDLWDGVKNFVIESVKNKAQNACAPIVVGVGIGGDFSSVGLLAKKALLRKIGTKTQDDFYAQKEIELLEAINKTNIGPMGLGGKTTALAVFIETKPTHIACLPVAVNFSCHSLRRKTIVL
ncbi:MAG: fumarate hydratase [Elusimicrobiota bacterium]|jgi:fumarate hydratase subunit alpha|nr:fumarate hydratase [Elusimicrobiota bacterium]